ncbi:hypothetical protein DCAR_0205240 [Daucus carota subsp. sativus]|uniref:Serine aminopeptidase S33 domain-containing protein n=1 Tax=Daucus carota subsp. sativus TaxID=79200 RepID=A0AAF0WAL3_DAUCS|nr:PREDICTED: monoglyceride lipase-like [Daucus carota subsp. sativus]WOG86044.1 hypothetical protein DCAR_0205240 [Daucus carota subsp. sativus]
MPMDSGNEMTAVMLTSGASGRINALISLRAWRSFLTLLNAFLLIFLFPFRGRRKSPVTPPVSPEKPGGNKGLPAVRVPTNIVPWKSWSTEVAARRSLAIRRVTQESAALEGESAREFCFFGTPRGETLFTQKWAPVLTEARGLVVLLHGLNEHSGRYSDFAKKLNANGYKVYGMDWIGHGGSDGLHAYVHSLDDAVTDVKSFIGKVLADNPGLPLFCFGHSTGAAILLKAVLDPKIGSRVDGVVVTSPAVGVQPSHPILRVVAPIFSVLLPTYQFGAANKQGTVVSRDPAALLAKYSDPLVYTGSIRVRTGYEILRISAYLQQNLEKLTVPFLVLHGSADAITDPVASQRLYKEASSADKSIKLFPGLLHDLLFEPEREEIMLAIIEWLNKRVQYLRHCIISSKVVSPKTI